MTVDLAGKVPADATAVTVNLTGINPARPTYFNLCPSTDITQPLASTVNIGPGDTTPNQATVQIGRDGKIALYNHAGRVDAALDLVGYYAQSATARFAPSDPVRRIVDTRVTGNAIAGGRDLLVQPGSGAATVAAAAT